MSATLPPCHRPQATILRNPAPTPLPAQPSYIAITYTGTAGISELDLCPLQGSQCLSTTLDSAPPSCASYRYLVNNNYIANSFTCNDATCCLVAVCKDSRGCGALNYTINFVGTLNAGAIAGIVIGSVFILALCAAGLRARTRASAAPAVYAPIAGASAPPPQQQYPGAYPAVPMGSPMAPPYPPYQQPAYAQPAYQQPYAQPYPQPSYPQQGYQTAPATAPPPPAPQARYMGAQQEWR